MPDLLNTALSGLRSYQRALDVVGHNIANAGNEGYSRQRIELETQAPQYSGFGYVGSGVRPSAVTRQVDDFVIGQYRASNSEVSRLEQFTSYAARLDGLYMNDSTGLAEGYERFYGALSDLSNDPSAPDLRRNVMAEAEGLVSRFRTLDSHLSSLSEEVEGGITATVDEINHLASSIADLNNRISASPSNDPNALPNDLLDQRDQLIDSMSALVTVRPAVQDDGSLNVYIGSGQALVVGPEANRLAATRNAADPLRTEVSLQADGPSSVLTPLLSGGKLGGFIDTRGELLDPARAELGRMAAGLAESVNAVHREGMDLDGNLGADFFSYRFASVQPRDTNVGSATVSVSLADIAAMKPGSYQLRYDGANWNLSRLGEPGGITLSGSATPAGTLTAEGMQLDISGTPAAGDTYLVRPLHGVAGNLDVAIDTSRQIAAAVPVKADASFANTGSASVSEISVNDVNDTNLLDPSTVEFIGTSQYTVDGVGPFAWSAGASIDANGWSLKLDGQPAAGDTFTVSSNVNGTDDNRNLQSMIANRDTGVIDSGVSSPEAAWRGLVAGTGAKAAQADAALSAQTGLKREAFAVRESVSGVNLDEEAADLLRYQQAYQAAAQAMSVADTLFQSLLASVRR